MADRDPFILRRLADERAASLLALGRRNRTSEPAPGLRRTAGLAMVRLGEALVGKRVDPAPPLRPASAAR